MIRHIITTLSLAIAATLLFVVAPSTSHAQVVQTRLVSTYSCTERYSPVIVLGREQRPDGTWTAWHFVRTLDRWSNPNYPCPAASRTTRLHKATHHPRHLRVRAIARTEKGWAFVLMNNGAQWNVRPCAQEDSRRCWWDAPRVGNHIGRTFVSLYRQTFYVPVRRVS